MTQEHPITPPPELVQQWWDGTHGALYEFEAVTTQAARWGSDQELEACCEWVDWKWSRIKSRELRATRRPKLPSLKEQAMRVLLESGYTLDGRMELESEDIDIIHRALEQLND